MEFLDNWLAQTDGHANRPDNQGNPARGIFVIGTDTDVGKSYVACLLIRHLVARGLRVGAYKPVASGMIGGKDGSEDGSEDGDAEQLLRACGGGWPIERICPQRFKAAVAPPVAAWREGRMVDEALLREGADWWQSRCDVLVVEGAGGGLSPIGERTTVLDLACQLEYPVILVAEHRLGMMNHTLLTLEALAGRGLQTLALIINYPHRHPQPDSQETQLSETLECLLPFARQIVCRNLSCWVLAHAGSALSPAVG